MKKMSLIISLVFAISFATTSLTAKCYGFNKADIKVCINGDGNKERKAASETCKSVTGSDCGNITGNSGSCNGPKCYDESGKQNSKLKVD